MLFLVEPLLREVGPALFEILHTHNLRYPFPNDGNELVFKKFTNASVKSINFTFLLQDFRFSFCE